MQRLLLIDDQEDIRRLIQLTLEDEGCELHEAADGASGLEAARRLKPDVVLLDVMMPGDIDGLAVCRGIRADPALENTRVVLLTARGQGADREAGLAAGADEYLVKPFSPLALIAVVQRLQAGVA